MTIIFGRKLAVGDWVEWYGSQTLGVWKFIIGQIVAVIPPEISFNQWQEESGFDVGAYDVRSNLSCRPHKEASFLVAAAAPSGRGNLQLYWLQTQRLRKTAPPPEGDE